MYKYKEVSRDGLFHFEIYKGESIIKTFSSERGEIRVDFLNRIDGEVLELTSGLFGSKMKGIFYDESKLYGINGFRDGFYFLDYGSFVDSRKEIFDNQVYLFESSRKDPVIIDVGANIGLSSAYFKKIYPSCKVIAIEADPDIFNLLKKNTSQFNKIKLLNLAVGDSDGYLDFYSDKGMGGRTRPFKNQKPIRVKSIRLSKIIENEVKVDLLKIDVEGSELEILKESKELLNRCDKIFIEYHNFKGEKQYLQDILSILNDCGHEYHLTSERPNKKPFIDGGSGCENINFTVNIFSKKINKNEETSN